MRSGFFVLDGGPTTRTGRNIKLALVCVQSLNQLKRCARLNGFAPRSIFAGRKVGFKV
jgi:hypothetical protein